MAENLKQPEINLTLRYAEAEHLLQALDLMPEDTRKSVTHTGLRRQLTIIRDHWLKMERNRKVRQATILRNKRPKKIIKK